MFRFSLLPLFFLISILTSAQGVDTRWGGLLSRYVDEAGKVDYKSWVDNQEELNKYLIELSKHKLGFNSDNEEMAFWMNLYNASTVQKVLQYYPIKSIKDIENGKVWDFKFIKVNGKLLSLNQIENQILRIKFNDPRIHFGINCAAVSCPKLNNKAFNSSNVDIELKKLASEFINKTSKVNSSSIIVSKIFEWYRDDFIQNGSLVDYLNRYLINKVPNNTNVEYSNYNWSLNKK